MIELDGTHLSCADIVAAAHRRAKAVVLETARDAVISSHLFAAQAARARPIYGRSTGVGANRSIDVTGTDDHALSLLRSHATSAGSLRDDIRVRAMLIVRLNQLAAGGSGISPEVFDGLVDMVEQDSLPRIREHGSIGTGDLTALATTALAMIDEGVEFSAHDALPFISSNAATIGDAALAYDKLDCLARAYIVVSALTFVAVKGNDEAFAEVVEQVTPFDGARQVCQWMRELTRGAAEPSRIQDPFGLRTIPQVHGPVLDSLTRLKNVIEGLANAPAENPVFLRGELAHHGGFHASYLGSALNSALISTAQSAKLVLARLSTLSVPEFTDLPPFLGQGTPGRSGVMLLEYVCASALEELRTLTNPVGIQTVVLSRGVEEDASFASLAARQALAALPNMRIVVACELVAAMRALRSQKITSTNPMLAAAMEVCADFSSELEDRDLSGDIELAELKLPQLSALLKLE